uniref:Uncharacterized protein n=1 Tax=Physcomitrium patens TaxID=3218 RepID=A0A2K1JN72_PHYPA|nr:hypothetical protein PHYPA_017677 [Physcomitrium patens]
MSDTLLKTLPVLLTALLSFFCTFSAKIRHGVGNSMPVPTPNTVKKIDLDASPHHAFGAVVLSLR